MINHPLSGVKIADVARELAAFLRTRRLTAIDRMMDGTICISTGNSWEIVWPDPPENIKLNPLDLADALEVIVWADEPCKTHPSGRVELPIPASSCSIIITIDREALDDGDPFNDHPTRA